MTPVIIAATILSALYGPAWATVALGLASLIAVARQQKLHLIWKDPYE